MKKLLLVLLVLAVVGGSAFAFDPLSYPPALGGGGNVLLDAGVGYWYGVSGYGIGIPPLFVHVEYALPVEVPISVGGGISFFRLSSRYDYYSITWINPAARANWHWGFDVSWLDLYTGISLGWSIVSYGGYDIGYGAAMGGFGFGGQVGAHFYFSERVGAMIEAGYPYSKVGIAFKLGNQRFGGVRNTGGFGSAAVTTDVNMRSGPGLDYSVITSLREGTVVQLTGEIISGWTQVIYNGRRGWISSPYLTTRG
ncbi:MAG: SH3 domain-containing protein [Treponema sp.]|nr:SH3 domain-containing protein [Treponema sp.]